MNKSIISQRPESNRLNFGLSDHPDERGPLQADPFGDIGEEVPPAPPIQGYRP